MALPTVREDIQCLVAISGQAWQLAAHVLGSSAAAEDIVQQAYLQSLEHLPAGLPPEEARAWFLKVVANTARRHLRTELRRKRREVAVSAGKPVGTSGAEADIVPALRVALRALDEKYRLPVVMCYEQGLSQKTAAAVLDVSESTLSERIAAGLELLRRELRKAGYSAATTAVIGALAHTAPAVPATLAAAVEKIFSGRATAAGAENHAAHSFAKGGFTMKMIAGAVLVGTLAAGAALFAGGGDRGSIAQSAQESPASPPVPGSAGPVRRELFAFGDYQADLYVDGPRLEAGWGRSAAQAFDVDGNLFYMDMSINNLRCIRADGRVITIAGDGYANRGAGVESGPAARLRMDSAFAGYARVGMVVSGLPLKGEGAIHVALGTGSVYKIFKDPEHDGKWWYLYVAGSRDAKNAVSLTTTGESADAKKVKLQGCSIQSLKDGSLMFTSSSCAYRHGDGKLTCVLSPSDYTRELTVQKTKCQVKFWSGIGGGIYYHEPSDSFLIGDVGVIWRYWPKTKAVEHFVGTGQGSEGGADGMDGKKYGRDGRVRDTLGGLPGRRYVVWTGGDEEGSPDVSRYRT